MDNRRLELLEASVWYQIQSSVGPTFRKQFGISVLSDEGIVRLRAPRVRDLSLNRVYALGVEVPLTPDGLDALIVEFRDAGVSRFLISWTPVARPDDARSWFEERGFRRITSIARLMRRTDPGVSSPTDLTVVEAAKADVDRFGEIASRGNELASDYAQGLNSTIGHGGWRHYFALDGDRPVATAALYVEGDLAWAGLGGTLPDDRCRGAQSALLARRIRDAYEMGASWITAWTTAETPARPNRSLHNMLRLGFELTYEIENYVLDLSVT